MTVVKTTIHVGGPLFLLAYQLYRIWFVASYFSLLWVTNSGNVLILQSFVKDIQSAYMGLVTDGSGVFYLPKGPSLTF